MPNGLKEWLEAADHAATVLGIFAAGWWASWHFRLRRQRWPKAIVSQSVASYALPHGGSLLRVTATISNVGDVLLPLKSGLIRVQQLRPWPPDFVSCDARLVQQGHPEDMEYPWPLLAERRFSPHGFELEPNETEEFCFDLFVDSSVQTVIIYTYFANLTKTPRWYRLRARDEEIGWQKTTLCELQARGDESGTRDDRLRTSERREEAGAGETADSQAAGAGETTTSPAAAKEAVVASASGPQKPLAS